MELHKYKLGELLDVKRGASLAGEFYATKGKYIRLTCGNFDYENNCFKENTSKDDIYYIGNVREEFIMQKGDIITPLTEQAIGLLGSTAIIPESGKYIQSQDVAKIICNEELLYPMYAYYLISSASVKAQLSAAAQQTKIRHTSPDKIKDCVVWIPDLSAQMEVASVLSNIDKKISLNKQININLETLARQLYDYWFVQFDFPNENGNPYKSSGGLMVYDQQLKRNIPFGWEHSTLKEMCAMYQPQTLGLNDLVEEGKYLVYGANGIIGKYNSYNHEHSEVAMACRGSSCGTLNRTMPYSWITGNAMVMKMKDEDIHNEFLYHALSYVNVQGAITGSGQPQLTRENLQKLNILKPAREIMLLFSKHVEKIVDFQIQIKQEISSLIQQRNELLPLLMNGQITIE